MTHGWTLENSWFPEINNLYFENRRKNINTIDL